MRKAPRDQEESARKVTRRALFMGGCMSAMVAVLGTRMRYLQVDEADQFKLLAEENRINIRLIPPTRGLILDRNGKLIAGNEQNFRVTITREDAGDVEEVLNKLSHVIPLTAEDIDRVLKDVKRNSPFVPVVIAERLSWDDFSRVAVNAPVLPGVSPESGLSRIYPRGDDFAHTVGYTAAVSVKDFETLPNPEDPVLKIPKFPVGKLGVERLLEAQLRGKAGNKRIEVNSVGRVMRELERTEGTPGADIRLTIDADVQNFVQARLGSESAACVLIDVQTGDLIACASAPSYDPNLFVRGISHVDYAALTENDHRPLADKTVQGVYPPGSTFKMVTALAALEAGVINPDTTVYCPGWYELGGRRFHCYSRAGHGRLNLAGALMKSCDVYFYDTSQRVGIDKIAEMGHRLGLGQRHDLPMSAIAEGIMPDKDWKVARHGQEWRIGDTINASIGQGYVLASPLQLAVMAARVSTGRAVQPRLIHSIGGKEVPVSEAAALGIEGSLLRATRQGMHDVCNKQGGTGYSTRIVDKTMLMAGKSGTSQVRNITPAERERGVLKNEQLPWRRRDHALFVGYAPYDNPRYACAAVVEHGSAGSTVAGPIVRDALLRVMCGGIPPLEAYPEAQRTRIETQFKEMKLRDPETGAPTSSRA